jgi:ESCRT-I complex subunit MVB12
MATSTSDPITTVCIVVDPNKCPPNYELLLKSNERKDYCDLWKDGVFKSKVTRYLCYSRVASTYDSVSCMKEVLGDLVIQNDREMPPPGFRLLEKTIDTCEKATNKKQICIKMIPVSATTDAISEIIILSKSKRAPAGYTSAGDVNGLLVCFKMSKIAATAAAGSASNQPQAQNSGNQLKNGQHSTDSYAVNWWGLPPMYQSRDPTSMYSAFPVQRGSDGSSGHLPPFTYGSASGVPSSVAPSASQAQFTNSTETGSNASQNSLSGVPFRLNPRFADNSMFAHLQSVATLPSKSLIDIENEFNYVFNLESSTVSQTRN